MNWSSFDIGEYHVAVAQWCRGERGHADRRETPSAPGPRAVSATRAYDGARRRRDHVAAILQRPRHAGDAHRERRLRGCRLEHRRRSPGGRECGPGAAEHDHGRPDERVDGADAVRLLRWPSGTPVSAVRGTQSGSRTGQSDLIRSMASDGFSGSIGVRVGMEWEYFCGSLVETMKTASGEHAGHGGELGALKTRSARP
ncbi:hypothetical protein VPH35_064842 [Triticum aestivum]